MTIIYKKGNLLDAKTDVIAHQVNCQSVMGSGVAKQIKEKWPCVYDSYVSYCYDYITCTHELLGECQLVQVNDNQYVANLFGQNYYGKDGKRYTNYEALYKSLEGLANQMSKHNLKSVAIPYNMSCCRGGAKWQIVVGMICAIFLEAGITVEIWKLES